MVTPEGLPIGFEVFAGNTGDVTTVEAMIELMEKKYGIARRIWVLDRGMVSEENLDFLRGKNARYIVGTPKKQLKAFEAALLDARDWAEVHPDGAGEEQYVLCRSGARREKELAMLEQQRVRLRAQLDRLHESLARRPAKEPGKIERRIGRWLGRFTAAERLVEVEVRRDDAGHACGLQISERAERAARAAHAHGAYLLRTNCPEQDPAQLPRFARPSGSLRLAISASLRFWRWYMQLCQAEKNFRISKSDLRLRPVFHQSKRGSKPTSSSAFWHSHSGAPWRCGCAAKASETARANCSPKCPPCAAWTWSCPCPCPAPKQPDRTSRLHDLLAKLETTRF